MPVNITNKPPRAPIGSNGIFGGIFSKLNIADMETEDYILLLILYLMYKESGDTELLIILAAFFLS